MNMTFDVAVVPLVSWESSAWPAKEWLPVLMNAKGEMEPFPIDDESSAAARLAFFAGLNTVVAVALPC